MTQATNSRQCESCNAGIQNEDIIHRRAGLVGGVLLCPVCVENKRQEIIATQQLQADAVNQMQATVQTGMERASNSVEPTMARQSHFAEDDAPLPRASGAPREIGTSTGGIYIPPVEEGVRDVADEPLSLIDDEPGIQKRDAPKIRSFSEGSTLGGAHQDANLQRPLAAMAEPATRVRTFHGKLTAAGLAHMDDLINEWLDANPDIFIKQSTSSIGVFEGKAKESHLVVTILY